MNNMISKLLSALAISVALCSGMAATAFADVALEGTADGYELKIDGSGDYTTSDLFGEFKNVIPGDERTQEVVILNDSDLSVHVYLRAESHDDANGLTYDEAYEERDGKDQGQDQAKGDLTGGADERDETVESANSFLSLLKLRVENDENVIFDASPEQEAGLAKNVYLGTLSKGQSLNLDLTLSVPLEVDGTALGNAFANRVGEVDWVFTISEVVYPDPPDDPKDPDKPEGPLGQTGDTAPLALLSVVAVLAAVLVLVAAVMRRFGRR